MLTRLLTVCLSSVLVGACATAPEPVRPAPKFEPTAAAPATASPPPAAAAPTPRSSVPHALDRRLLDRRPLELASAGGPPAGVAAAGSQAPLLVHFIDAGQGNAVLFEFPCGAILVDTGGEEATVFPSVDRLEAYLDQVFSRRTDLNRTLELVALTHPHIDHTRGAQRIRERFTVRNVIDNGQANTTIGGPEQNQLHAWALANGVPYQAIETSNIPRPAGLTSAVIDPVAGCDRGPVDPVITALWGGVGHTNGSFSNSNNQSVVLRVDYGAFSALITGDLQKPALKQLIDTVEDDPAILDVDLYEVGHHGSHNATTDDLVALMTPKIAVISVGDPSRTEGQFIAFEFGHPNHLAMDALLDEDHGVSCFRAPVWVPVALKGRNPRTHALPKWEEWQIAGAVFATGWDGTVIVRALPSGAFSVKTQKTGQPAEDPGVDCG